MFSANSATLGLTATERVHIGRRAAEALAEEVQTLGAQRVFLLVSTTLRTTTTEISDIEAALGDSIACVFDGIKAHGPRSGPGPWARARAHKMSILSNLTFLQKRRASSVRVFCPERRAEFSHMRPKTAEIVVC